MSASVVPARAGMSLLPHRPGAEEGSGPRASGDEPLRSQLGSVVTPWSPRERG